MKIITYLLVIVFALLFASELTLTSFAQINNEEDQKKYIDTLKKVIKPEYDEMEETTWFHHKEEDKVKGIGIYIGEKNDITWLRFFAGSRGSDWIHFDKIIILAKYEKKDRKDFKLTITIDPFERWDNVTETATKGFKWGKIVCDERIDIKVGDRIKLSDLKNIAAAKSLKVRFSGTNLHRDYEMKKRIIQSISDMLDYYELVIGKENNLIHDNE